MKLPDDKLLQDECSQTSLYEMSRNRLRVIEKLGEGNFGMVSVSLPNPSLHRRINPSTLCEPVTHASRPRTEDVGGGGKT